MIRKVLLVVMFGLFSVSANTIVDTPEEYAATAVLWAQYCAMNAQIQADFMEAIAPIVADTTLTAAQRRARLKPYWDAKIAAYDAAAAMWEAEKILILERMENGD